MLPLYQINTNQYSTVMTTPRETTPKDPNNPTTPNPPIPITIPLIPPFNLPTQLSQKLKIPHQPLLESMFYRISQTITEMLDRIKYIFQLSGIESYIHSYHSAIFKLIVPVQLMSYVWYGEHKGMVGNQFKGDAMDIMFGSNIDSYTQLGPINRKSNQYFSQLRDIPQIKIDLFNLLPTPVPDYQFNQRYYPQNKNYQKRDTQQTFQSNYYHDRQQHESLQRRGRKYVLDEQASMKLCEWIRYQATNVSRPTMKQVVEKAKLLTKSRRFRGSTGWCYQFILRHPFIKDCINRAGSRLESPPKTPQQELEQKQIPPFKYAKMEKDAQFLRYTDNGQAQSPELMDQRQFQAVIPESPQQNQNDESQQINQAKDDERQGGSKWRSSWYDGNRGRRVDEDNDHYYRRN